MIFELNHNQLQKVSNALNEHVKHSGGIIDLIENLNSLHHDYSLILMKYPEEITSKTPTMIMELQETINILKSANQN